MLDSIGIALVGALQKDGRASWTQIAQATGIPVSTAYRRGTALLENGDIRVAMIPAMDVYLKACRIYELLLRCRPGAQRAVAARLAARDDMRWVAVITGESGVAAELVVAQGEDVAALLLDDIESDPDVVAIQTSLVLKSLPVANDWQLRLGRTAAPSAGPANHECDQSHLDDSDRAILELLRDDGRRTYTSIAAELQMNEATVRRRCSEMLRLGCARIITLIQPHLLGYGEEVQVRLDVMPQQLEAAMQMLAERVGVHYVAATFGETSLICEIWVPSHEDLYEFMRDVIAHVPGMTRMSAEIELVTFKRAFVRCPWATAGKVPRRVPEPRFELAPAAPVPD